MDWLDCFSGHFASCTWGFGPEHTASTAVAVVGWGGAATAEAGLGAASVVGRLGAAKAMAAAGAQQGEAGLPLWENSLNGHREPFLKNKILLFKPAAPSKHPASHTAQLSNQTVDYPGQGPSQPNSSPFFRRHPTLQFLW